MQTLLGNFLRQLRFERRLSQTRAARLAGIGRVTLNRWESGARQPHKSDLEILLSSLAANSTQREQAFAFLSASRGGAQNREDIIRVCAQHDLGPMPNIGTFLWALRMRSGLSQEEAAQRTGVTERTLRRWEKSEVRPSSGQLQTLCYVLGAHTEEMLALTTGLASPVPETLESPRPSLEELKEQAHTLFFYTTPQQKEALKDLSFFLLESQAWPFALRSESGRQVLSQIYSFHAAYLSTYQRWSESSVYAARALDLLPQAAIPDEVRVMAGIAAARSQVYGGARAAPLRGIEVLRPWLSVTEWPNYKAWLLSDLAQYLVLTGDTADSLELAKQAREMAAQCENPFELYHRTLDEAQVLIWAGKPDQALISIHSKHNRLTARLHLMEAEAYLKLDELSLAHARLQDTLRIIEARNSNHLRPQAQKMEARLANYPHLETPLPSEPET